MSYDLGDTVPLSVQVTDGAGSPTDATSVTLTITLRGGGAVADTTPTSPTTGRYEFDFVPAQAGLYDVVWRSTGPAAAFDDVVDVRATARRVISLADARDYLNKVAGGQVDEDELRTMMAGAVERVDRHLFTRAERDAGRTLASEPTVSESQVLAVKMVLAEFWRTQRSRLGGRGAGMAAAAAAIDSDSGPAGTATLTVRLTDLLGPPLGADAGGVPQPAGSFPPACGWPDPADQVTWGRW
ncbi:hypothetical protein [Pseudonocardia sp. 73-21]|uniref:hypothetical protein n=1 Tax=Pseudonocardia sp. 73-21 TaxID=1895809 RepID=UPI00095EF08C|nr:hypothetical protein [Pseudonocardia sp. 73-21]OJY47601.1 MAG: hypothetical protein BGP03_33250 [Pseudonocardia sp. 73-21]